MKLCPKWHARLDPLVLLVGLAPLGCQTLIGLNDVGPRPEDTPASRGGAGLSGASASGGADPSGARSHGGAGASGASPSGGQAGVPGEPPCNDAPPLGEPNAVPPLTATHVLVAPTIDGEIDPAFCQARAFSLRHVGGDRKSPELAGTGRLLWDAKHLYLALQMVDDQVYTDRFSWYENDSFWLGFDATPGDGASDELLFGMVPGQRELQNFESWPRFDLSKVFVAQSRASVTSSLEISIAWETLPNFMVAAGAELGFEWRVNDTEDGSTFATLSWASASSESDRNPDGWGRVTLAGP